jgi:hypothetical protein
MKEVKRKFKGKTKTLLIYKDSFCIKGDNVIYQVYGDEVPEKDLEEEDIFDYFTAGTKTHKVRGLQDKVEDHKEWLSRMMNGLPPHWMDE